MAKTTRPLSGRTSRNDEHTHAYRVNKSGNGQTGTVHKHRHGIKDWRVLQANGHRHSLRR